MRRVVARIAPIVGVWLGVGFAVGHASQVIRGNLLLVKENQPGVVGSKRRIVVVGKELPPGDGDTITGDPTVSGAIDGATVQVILNGGPLLNQTQTLPMPASRWKRSPTDASKPLAGYRYSDPKPGLYGPVRTAVIKYSPGKPFVIKLVIDGTVGGSPQPPTLVPPDPGTSGGAIFTMNGGDSYCISFGGAAGGLVRNSPTTPPQNKVFRITDRPTAPTVEAGCVVPEQSCELVDPETGQAVAGLPRPACRKLSGGACVPRSGATVLGLASAVPDGVDACCCDCVDANTEAPCVPDPAVPDGPCVCAFECATQVESPPPVDAIDRFTTGSVPCDADRSITVEGGCTGVREVLYLTPASGAQQRGQPSGVCVSAGVKLANKIAYLRHERTGMADASAAPLPMCPFDGVGDEVTEDLLRATGSIYTLIAPRASYQDYPDDDDGCDGCAAACMAASCDGSGDVSGLSGCPGPDGIFGTADDGISNCDTGVPGQLRLPDQPCYEGACGGSTSGAGLLQCSGLGYCECGGWLQPCCASGSACGTDLTCVGATPGFCVLCGTEGLPCCPGGGCGGNSILENFGPHGAAGDGTTSPPGPTPALHCDASGGVPGICRLCGERNLPCCPVPDAASEPCSAGLTCDAGRCVGSSLPAGLCVAP